MRSSPATASNSLTAAEPVSFQASIVIMKSVTVPSATPSAVKATSATDPYAGSAVLKTTSMAGRGWGKTTSMAALSFARMALSFYIGRSHMVVDGARH
jgi:hypothetical protein